MILAGVIALSRLYVGVHYPSDVLGGMVVGILPAGQDGTDADADVTDGEKKKISLKANTEAAFILPPVLFLYPLKINFLFRCCFARAASTNPLNKGCGRFGLDFSSGCA